jgi:hypothetical protein
VPIKFAALLLLIPAALAAQNPVIVELFTSEGCSSCPPADKLLAQLEHTQPVLVLSEHVDYWNRLGWRDPFSSAQFSQRQNDYATAFHKDGVYTPQMVVDGRAEFVGNDAGAAKAAIQKAASQPKATVTLTQNSGGLIVNIEGIPAKAESDVFLAITEAGLRTDVTAGENSGRMLSHTGVVRSLNIIGRAKGGSFSKQAGMSALAPHQQAIVFVQDRRTRAILGAAALPYSK